MNKKKLKPDYPLGTKLRQLRVNAGYTQQNVADVLNINRSTYTYYETGKTTPDIMTLRSLSKIFKVSIDAFLEDDMARNLESAEGRRPKKIPKDNPKKIGDLSSDEKLLIALLRTSDPKELPAMIEAMEKKSTLKRG